ncbi:MAG: hypothetical protein IT462_03630 [Planctomycetes bacterium]|nr:hypothetical protein [Planctomycetota bacterium]
MTTVLSFTACERALVRGGRLDLFGLEVQFNGEEFHTVVELEHLPAGTTIGVRLIAPDGDLLYATEIELIPVRYGYYQSVFRIPNKKRHQAFCGLELFLNDELVAERPATLRGSYEEEEEE